MALLRSNAGQMASAATTSDAVISTQPSGMAFTSPPSADEQAAVDQRQTGGEQDGLVRGRHPLLVRRLRAEPEQQRPGHEQQHGVDTRSAACAAAAAR